MPIRLQVTSDEDPSRAPYRYEFDGDRSTVVLGRRGGVDVLLPHPKVSLAHARIERRGTRYFLVDEGSTHGTTLNGVRLRGGTRASLRPGDRIGIADFIVEVAVSLTELDGPGDNSPLIARRMVRDVLERLGPREAQPRIEPERGPPLHLPDLGRSYILGFGADGHLALDTVDMWREHVSLERDESGVSLRPLGPSTGLRVDGKVPDGPTLLRDGATLVIGDLPARYFDPAEAYLRRLEVAPEPVIAAPPRARAAARNEWLLVAAGLLAMALGGVGLLWVLRW